MEIVGVRAMKNLERLASEKYRVSVLSLMEHAGERLAFRVQDALGFPERDAQVTVLAGSGKNGGDGLVAARHLAQAGVRVTVLLLPGSSWAPETRANLLRYKKIKAVLKTAAGAFPPEWLEDLRSADLVVDALLGIGLSGPLRPAAVQAIAALNASHVKVCAADIPSGLDAETGEPSEPTVRADWTVTFGLPKRGLLASPAADFVGRLIVEPINFPPALLAVQGAQRLYLDADQAAAWLPRRTWSDHKRSVGKVLVIGGSAQYHGAPLLAALGAACSGAGYTALAYPRQLDAVMRAHTLEEIAIPLPGTPRGALGATALNTLLKLAADYEAVVVGPGLGRDSQTQTLVRRFLDRVQGPLGVVVDADALAALPAWHRPRTSANRPPLILTPHEGEAGVLLGRTAAAVHRERETAARDLAQRFQAIVVLKGHHTLITSPTGAFWVNASGSPALATAGTGDVLSGCIAAWVAQRVPAAKAAGLGAYVQGVAGDLAARNALGLGVRAREVAERLPEAIGTLCK